MPKQNKPAVPAQREDRVWIELEMPASKEEGDRRANLANNMLARLSEGKLPEKFWWSTHEGRYCYGGTMGYRVLTDHGEWFNLEYLGRPL